MAGVMSQCVHASRRSLHWENPLETWRNPLAGPSENTKPWGQWIRNLYSPQQGQSGWDWDVAKTKWVGEGIQRSASSHISSTYRKKHELKDAKITSTAMDETNSKHSGKFASLSSRLCLGSLQRSGGLWTCGLSTLGDHLSNLKRTLLCRSWLQHRSRGNNIWMILKS